MFQSYKQAHNSKPYPHFHILPWIHLICHNSLLLKGSGPVSMLNVHPNLFFFTPIPKFVGLANSLRKNTFSATYSSTLLRVKCQPTSSSIQSGGRQVNLNTVYVPNPSLCHETHFLQKRGRAEPTFGISSKNLEAI